MLGISVDGVSDHQAWSKDIEASQGHAVTYPLIGDPELAIVKAYDLLPADAGDTSAGRTPMDNATARSVFVIGPDKKIKATLTYPMSTGRNFAEILRLVDSCQLTAGKQVATPANWGAGRQGDHSAVGVGRGGQGDLPGRLGAAAALHPHRAAAEVAEYKVAGAAEASGLRAARAGVAPRWRANSAPAPPSGPRGRPEPQRRRGFDPIAMPRRKAFAKPTGVAAERGSDRRRRLSPGHHQRPQAQPRRCYSASNTTMPWPSGTVTLTCA